MQPYISCIIVLFAFSLSACRKDLPHDPVSVLDLNFEKTFGGSLDDHANDILVKNGTLFILGTTSSIGSSEGNFYLITTDIEGRQICEKTYGSSSEEAGVSLISIGEDHLLLVGYTRNTISGDQDILLYKVDLSGEVILKKTFGGAGDDYPVEIKALSNGQICILGTTKSFGSGAEDLYVIWLDQNGLLIQEKTYGGTGRDGGSSFIELDNQDLILFGYTNELNITNQDYYVLRVSPTGDTLWTKTFGGAGYEESQAIAYDQNNQFIINGHSSSLDPHHDMYAIKLNGDGQIIWEKHYGGMHHDGGHAIIRHTNGNFTLIARSNSFEAQAQDALMLQINSDGKQLSKQLFGGSADDRINQIITHGAFFYMIGETASFGQGARDVYLIKHFAN